MTEEITERGCVALVLILLLKKPPPHIYLFSHPYLYPMILAILSRAKPPNFQVILVELAENSTLTNV